MNAVHPAFLISNRAHKINALSVFAQSVVAFIFEIAHGCNCCHCLFLSEVFASISISYFSTKSRSGHYTYGINRLFHVSVLSQYSPSPGIVTVTIPVSYGFRFRLFQLPSTAVDNVSSTITNAVHSKSKISGKKWSCIISTPPLLPPRFSSSPVVRHKKIGHTPPHNARYCPIILSLAPASSLLPWQTKSILVIENFLPQTPQSAVFRAPLRGFSSVSQCTPCSCSENSGSKDWAALGGRK